MNSKRQTIWLVSMLSLMVVLSAYYLFTEDASKLDSAKDATETEQINVDTKVTTPDTLTNPDTATQAQTDEQTSTETITDKVIDKITDEAVLEKVEQQGKSKDDYIMAQQMQRNDNLAKRMDSLMTIINDAKQNTEAVGKAYDDLQTIQTQTAKINDLEEELGRDFPNVIVTNAANKWKVVLQDNKLENSQAVSIIDLVMKELNVSIKDISIQVMPE